MEFVCLGGFRNVRGVYDWNGLKLELDETQYDFNISYEIECESDDPENVKMVLKKFLNENAVEYSYSEISKFVVCRSGKLPEYNSLNRVEMFISKIAKDYVRLLKYGDSLYRCNVAAPRTKGVAAAS
ncbi:hypothetical protein IFM89_008692 [Coptis chinensis]|uniref:CYTH domain-containing protein n=1 Tax=Coptis chinensis TaxID=261450 RepID=A0A835GVF1_9MAGN|nr:hypothetical protein IFM89_008692 [Coptis chinensis]